MLKMRLQRKGKRNDPQYRVVVTDKVRGPKSGKIVETVGYYNPRADKVEFYNERTSYWLENGVQPSKTVHNFLIDAGLREGKKINVLPQKSPVKSEEGEANEASSATELASESAEDTSGETESEGDATETTEEGNDSASEEQEEQTEELKKEDDEGNNEEDTEAKTKEGEEEQKHSKES